MQEYIIDHAGCHVLTELSLSILFLAMFMLRFVVFPHMAKQTVLKQGLQHRLVLLVIFSPFLKLFSFGFVVAITDLV